MSLFCGRINLAGVAGLDNVQAALAPMLAALAGKGVGAAQCTAASALQAATRQLTAECPSQGRDYVATLANGELALVGALRLDNRAALAAQLPGTAPDDGDAALALAAYAHWGEDCATHFQGEFAFALWDARKRQAWCARDPSGAMPFYYAHVGNWLVFGNDVAAVAADPAVPAQMNLPLVRNFLDTEMIFPPGVTLHAHVMRLPKGHCLRASTHGLRQTAWWNAHAVPDVRFAKAGDYVEALDALLAEVVAAQAGARQRVATQVTGGLDSSTVSGVLAETRRAQGLAQARHYSWTPEPRDADEAAHPEAAMLAAFCEAHGIALQRVAPDVAGILEYFARDPVVHPHSNMLLMELALQRQAQADGVSAIFSGHGGDQGLSYRGRALYPSLLLAGRWRTLANEVAATHDSWIEPVVQTAGRFWQAARRTIAWTMPFASTRSPDTYRRLDSHAHAPRRRWHTGSEITTRGTVASKLAGGYTDQRIEAWFEAGSRRGLRYHYPLLDRRILDFALGLPPEMFLHQGQERWIMRQIAARHAPAEVAANTSKTEPTRASAATRALDEARPALVAAIDAMDPASPRAAMIDVARLRHDLATQKLEERGGRSPRFGRKRAALEVLDIVPRPIVDG